MVLVGDYVYGGRGNNDGVPTCLDFLTGKIAWNGKSPGQGSAAVLYADGNIYFRYQNGTVALVEATPEAFRLKGTLRTTPVLSENWAYPVIQNRKLYLRDDNVLTCYDVSDGS